VDATSASFEATPTSRKEVVKIPWFKVDDGFHGHPKVVELSLGAVGLWTLCGSWCAKYLTDGFVPDKTVVRLGGTPEQAAELFGVDLWLAADGGFSFRDWEQYQPLKSDIEAERAAAQERMRGVRAKKKGVRANDDRTTPERSGEQNPKFARSSENVRVTPSHPIPSHPNKDNVQKSARDYASEFAVWWETYPRKQGKADALKAYQVIAKKVDAKTLLAGAQAYGLLSIGEEKSFLKLPAGWLRGERWADEQIVNATKRTTTDQPADCNIHPGYPKPCDACAREGRDF
jgi:hypothetical protein